MSKVEWPGALASSATDGAADISHLLKAAVGRGSCVSLPLRNSRFNTPDFCADNESRLVAVRSNPLGLFPASSTMTAPMAGERTPSAAARSAAMLSGASAWTIASGSIPSSAMPGGYSRPCRRASPASVIHKMGLSFLHRSASSNAIAAALVASVFSAAWSSCRAALGKPSAPALPRKAASIRSTPNVKCVGPSSASTAFTPDADNILASRAFSATAFFPAVSDTATGLIEGASKTSIESESIMFMVCSNL